ncbi:hypothetical protein YC2023_050796 [Brassica napus]
MIVLSTFDVYVFGAPHQKFFSINISTSSYGCINGTSILGKGRPKPQHPYHLRDFRVDMKWRTSEKEKSNLDN